MNDIERAFDASKYGEIPDAPFLDITIPTLHDPSLAPAGAHVMSIHVQYVPFTLAHGRHWSDAGGELLESVLRTLGDYAPDLRASIVAQQVITPADLQETYGLSGGHPYHGEPSLDQLFTMRPILGWAQYQDTDSVPVSLRRRHAPRRRRHRRQRPQRLAGNREGPEAVAPVADRSRARRAVSDQIRVRSARRRRGAGVLGVASAARAARVHCCGRNRSPRARGSVSRAASAERVRNAHQFLTDKPHVAGSERDRELADWTAARFREAGLEDVGITTHEVLLPYPQTVRVEMPTAEGRWNAAMREDVVPGDPHTAVAADPSSLPYHAYSASGTVTAPVVYAGSGNPADYDWLLARGIDVRGRIALVRYSSPYSYRGYKAYGGTPRRLGILMYSDPADDGFAKGVVYPDGPWGPDSHVQRGGVGYDFLVPGDPQTPGWPSTPGARRLPISEVSTLPGILSAPLSSRDARDPASR